MREWADNTGTFRVVGRLVKINDDSIRLLKENGNFSTVPLRRLSAGDMELVNLIVKNMGAGEIGQVAAR